MIVMNVFSFDFDAAFNEIFGKADNATNSTESVVLSLYYHSINKELEERSLDWYNGKPNDPSQWDTGKWYDNAVEGDVIAQNNLGCCFYVDESYSKAINWISKAAEQGFSEAQLGLGICYSLGNGVDEDDEKAMEWFTKAAVQGLATAQFMLGASYYAAENEEKGLEWLTKAAEQGLPEVQMILGEIFLDEDSGAEKDEKEAVRWLTKAARHGLARAQYNLACCYQEGMGIDKDEEKAKGWCQKAAKQGHKDAKDMLLEMGWG